MSASATFNWAYKPGVTNKYGLTVPAGADNARPAGWCYVALYGNDSTGNGSRQLPYRTITKAATLGTINLVLGSGVYRELAIIANTGGVSLIGDGDVAIDISYNGALFSGSGDSSNWYNIKFMGNGVSTVNTVANPIRAYAAYDVVFDGAYTGVASYNGMFTNCIISNYAGNITPSYTPGTPYGWKNCTFINCNSINAGNNFFYFDTCILHTCNISVSANTFGLSRYTMFYHCNFKLNGVATGGVLYPSTPSGYTYYSDINTLKTAYSGIYTGANLIGCNIADPLFNNLSIGDYTLQFSSPAKNLSYFGTYAGAHSIAQPLRIRAVEADGDFDFSTAVNVTITDNSIVLTDDTQDGIIETNVIENTFGRQIKSIPITGFNSDRNGKYIDSIADLSATTYAAGDTLPVNMPFIVESGAITYNGNVYSSGQRGTTVAAATVFSTSTGGVMREITEAPQRHTVEMKLSDVQPFTTEVYNHFEPGITPTTNNVGDSRTGDILRGNGDPAYVRGSTVEFPVNKKYIKIKFTIRANNLKP